MLKEVGIDRPYVISGKPEHCWMEEKLKKKKAEEVEVKFIVLVIMVMKRKK